MSDRPWKVTLRRANGRFVKSTRQPSRYAAKQIRDQWETKYDTTFYVEIERVREEGPPA